MKKNKYYWGIIKYKEDAQQIGEYIQFLEKEYSNITPELLVLKASDENNIMHNMFQWDDTIAAVKYREAQASKILGAIKIRVEESKIENIRAFVHVRSEQSEGFQSIGIAVQNPDSWEYVMENAEKEMNTFIEKYNRYKEFSSWVRIYLSSELITNHHD
jgi:hypothetical protein